MNILNKRLITGLAATMLAAIYSQTAFAADATGNAAANVLAPLSITQNGPGMNFGSVSGDTASATTVILTPAGTVSSPDGAFVVPTSGAVPGIFDVIGAPNAAYDITLPAAAVTLTSGGDTLTVDTFTDDTAGTGTLAPAGTDSFNVGATLNLGAAQPVGNYTGTFTVTVNYQ